VTAAETTIRQGFLRGGAAAPRAAAARGMGLLPLLCCMASRSVTGQAT
jgi:hypothetical protein